jgi:hypothetical protein
MAYAIELHPGQHLHIHNSGNQTVVTLTTAAPGQQQQASTSVTTGRWTAVPVLYRTHQGGLVKLATAQGDRYLSIQGTSMQLVSSPSVFGHPAPVPLEPVPDPTPAPPMAPMPPLEPMSPMKPMNLSMGNMQMSMQPMEMRMGDMTLGTPPPAAPARRFCSQCGASVQPSDRFCAACGHHLGE